MVPMVPRPLFGSFSVFSKDSSWENSFSASENSGRIEPQRSYHVGATIQIAPLKKPLTLIFHVELVVGGGGQKIIIL